MGFSFDPKITGLIEAASSRHGVDPIAMKAIAHLESRGRPDAKNPRSSAGGLYQFIDATARDYGLKNRFDPAQAADAGARLARDNSARLSKVLGRAPTAGELYLAHQQGGGGATKLLQNPNARAVDIVGRAAVKLNGGNENMTAGEFAALWTRKADKLAGSAPQPSAPTGAAQSSIVSADAFQAALARLQGATGAATSTPYAPTEPPSFQDRLASVGASLVNLDQGRPMQIDTNALAAIADKIKGAGIFKKKGFSL